MIDKILSEEDARNLFKAHCFYTSQTRDAVTEDCLCDLFGREIAVYIRKLRSTKNGLHNCDHSSVSEEWSPDSRRALPDPFSMWADFETGKRESVLIYDYLAFSIAVSLHNQRLLIEKYHGGEIL